MTAITIDLTTDHDLPPGGSTVSDPKRIFWRDTSMPEQFDADITSIVPGRWQPRSRFDEAKLDELAASIKEHGVLNRLKVFYNEAGALELIAGERRWRAAARAGLSTVPVEVVEWTARQIAEVAIIDNVQRDNLMPDEEGAAFTAAIETLGVSEAELARRLGKGRTYIQQRRAIAGAGDRLREALASGQLTFSQARGILAGAGGNSEAEEKAVKVVLGALKNGQQVTEADARTIGWRAFIQTYEKPLRALGWSLLHHTDAFGVDMWGWIYSSTHAPRAWTAQEVREVVTHQVRGDIQKEKPKPTVPDKEVRDLLELKGYRVNPYDAPPWLLLGNSAEKSAQFYSADGLAQKAQEIAAEVMELARRCNAHGYQLVRHDGWLRLHKGKMVASYPYGYMSLEKAYDATAAIEGGTEIEMHTASSPSSQTCQTEGCQNKEVSWREGPAGYAYYCKSCHAAYTKAKRKEREAAQRSIVQAMQPIARAAGEQELRLLIMLLAAGNSSAGKELAQKAMDPALDTEQLRDLFVTKAAAALWGSSYPNLQGALKDLLKFGGADA